MEATAKNLNVIKKKDEEKFMPPYLTILTPTFNRGYILPRLYESLCRQSDKDFIWLIVDDGSDDNTCEIVEKWCNDNVIHIQYLYQENGGKHRAHNYGVKNVSTELVMICDSDDYLTDDAVKSTIECWREFENDKSAGIIAYMKPKDENGNILPYHEFGTKNRYVSLREVFEKQEIFETVQIYKSNILQEYLFPEVQGEKFFPEIYIWMEIDKKYNLIALPKTLQIFEYQNDGYTKNDMAGIKKNPVAYSYLFNQKYNLSNSFINKCIEYGKCRAVSLKTSNAIIPSGNILVKFFSIPFIVMALIRYK